ncbi:MAG: malonyl-CoA synthase [Sphingomonadaceae bacterium]|nr:malonyl-CoA synthase [Sphingomonadaceae bacterium]
MSANLFTRLAAAGDPAAPFIVTPDGTTLSYSYAGMRARTAQLANMLVAVGVAPGDRVAAQTEKGVDALLLYLAAVRAGAVFLPLNTAYTPAELDYFLGDAEPRLFVCGRAAEAALAPVARKAGVAALLTLDADGGGTVAGAAAAQSPEFADVLRSGDDLAAILYTSGTTGRSKGAMLSHDNLWSNAATLKDIWHFTAADRLIHALPIYHVHGLFVATNTVMAAGAAMLFLPRFDARGIVAAMGDANVLMGVPTFYSRLLDEPALTEEAARGMRLFVSGSAPLSAEVHRRFRVRTGHAVLERYGMTETGMITSNPYDGDRIAGTVGFPLPDVSVRIADQATGAISAQGEVGMIEVKGPNVFKGYWRKPEKTAEEFRADGYFVTGDLGRIDDRGYVHIVGRAKDLVISGGLNVYPAEVEDALDALPGVAESAVIGVPHADLGEAVVAVVRREGGSAIDEAAIGAALRDRLARFKQPKAVRFVDEMPRNAMGKIQKKALRERFAGLFAAAEVAS